MLLQLKNITKQYTLRKANVINALSDITLNIEEGQFVTITGPSGSGKSTLLYLLGGLLKPSSGSLHFKDLDLTTSGESVLSDYRKRNIGYVMQSFSLVPYLTAEENIMVAASLLHSDKKKQKKIARELLTTVGMLDRIEHYPKELSSGQQQRVAIARAMANNPSIILADEPTGNLDPALASEILSLLSRLNKENSITVIMVTHSPEAAEYGNMKILLKEGMIQNINKSDN